MLREDRRVLNPGVSPCLYISDHRLCPSIASICVGTIVSRTILVVCAICVLRGRWECGRKGRNRWIAGMVRSVCAGVRRRSIRRPTMNSMVARRGCYAKGSDDLRIVRDGSSRIAHQRIFRMAIRVRSGRSGRRVGVPCPRATSSIGHGHADWPFVGKMSGRLPRSCRCCSPATISRTVCVPHLWRFVGRRTGSAHDGQRRVVIWIEAILLHFLASKLFLVLALLPSSPKKQKSQHDERYGGERHHNRYGDFTSR